MKISKSNYVQGLKYTTSLTVIDKTMKSQLTGLFKCNVHIKKNISEPKYG